MASLTRALHAFNNVLLASRPAPLPSQCGQVRTKYGDWRTIRDHAKRQCVRELGIDRLRVNAIRKNTILPPEIRELADAEIAQQPRNSNYMRTVPRCVVTSRPKGVVLPWRLSRIMFRHIVDYNQMSGIIRAKW